jgi:hypothetical protein
MEELIELVGQDVHRALVLSEADRICRAFHVDDQRPWRLSAPTRPLGAEQDDGDDQGEILDISISYSGAPLKPIIDQHAVPTAPMHQRRAFA